MRFVVVCVACQKILGITSAAPPTPGVDVLLERGVNIDESRRECRCPGRRIVAESTEVRTPAPPFVR